MSARFSFGAMVVCLALCSVISRPAVAQGHHPSPHGAAAAVEPPAEASAAEPAKDEEKPKLKDFAEVTKETTLASGFFDVYSKPGTTLLAIGKDQWDLEFALVFELAQGVGARGLNGGTMLNIFEPELVRFVRDGDTVRLIERPYQMKTSDRDLEAAVELGFSESVLAVAKVESEREDGAALIDIGEWLTSDTLAGLERGLGFALSNEPDKPARVTLDGKRSYVEYVKSFPENTRFRSKLTFTLAEPPDFNSLADPRNLPLSLHTNFVRLPEDPMEPRLADDRMGYFMTVHKDFGSQQKEWFTRYVNRWRLERGKKRGDLYEPKEPIVYYVDRTVPERFRKPMMQAVENWQRAFEAAGWKNAIRAEMLPDDVDPEDIRYATLRWVATDQPGYLAIGPSVVDPRTGEILDADILFDAAFVLRVEREWTNVVDPVSAVRALMTEDPRLRANGYRGEHACFATQMALEAGVVRASLLASGALQPGDPLPKEFVEQFLLWVTMHEVGHSLGLRHNFRSSTDTPIEALHDLTWTEQNGLVSSVMDYAAANIAPGGQKNGLWYGNHVGSSDNWVISYGYVEDDKQATEIARRGAERGHAYAGDEERTDYGAIDPTVNAWDLGADPLLWSKQRGDILRGLLPQVDQFTLMDNAPHSDLTAAVQQVLGSIGASLTPVIKYVGGQYTYRDHIGDPNARAPFVPVPRARQIEALEYLVDSIFDEGAFALPPAMLAKLGAQRWSQWGMPDNINGRLDYPYHEIVSSMQGLYLGSLLSAERLSRMSDAELKFGSETVLTVPELFASVSDAIWSELGSTRRSEIASTRRNLQRAHIDHLSTLVVEGPRRLPPDARSLARAELRDLKSKAEAALASQGASFDRSTTAHLQDVVERAQLALTASLSTKLN